MIVDKLQLFSYIVFSANINPKHTMQKQPRACLEFLLVHKYNAILIMYFTL